MGGLAIAFLVLAFIAANLGPTAVLDDDGRQIVDPERGLLVHYGWLSLAPALVTVVLAFTTRQVLFALLMGVTTGAVVYSFGTPQANGTPLQTFLDFSWLRLNAIRSFFIPQMGTAGFAQIIVVYLWCLGGLIGLWSRTGGAVEFAQWVGHHLVRGPRSAKIFTWALGIIFHQGGNISTVLAGTTARPVIDEHPIAKEEAAYIVDSTASSAATLLPFNAWPIYIASVAAGTIGIFTTSAGLPDETAVIGFYFAKGMWFNWYGILAITFTLLMAAGILPPILGMKKARDRVAQTGETVKPGSRPLSSKELTELQVPDGYRRGLADFAVPMLFLVAITVIPLIIKLALGNDANVYIAEAFFAAVVIAVIVAVAKGMPLRTALDGVLDGAKGVTIAIIILGIAVSLKGVTFALGTDHFVAGMLGGMPAIWLAPLLMVAAMIIAFSTGTSFGTFAVLFPIGLPLAAAILPGNETIIAMAFGAILGGSIFGDQASPISDTTILSSLAVGCDVMDHVTTQLPYAVTAALLAATGYVVTGIFIY